MLVEQLIDPRKVKTENLEIKDQVMDSLVGNTVDDYFE